MIVNDGFVTLEYAVVYTNPLPANFDVVAAEKFLTRTLFKSFRARQRALWHDLQIDVTDYPRVASAAAAMLLEMQIRCAEDGSNLQNYRTPVVIDPIPVIRYLYVSPVEHRVIYSFATGYDDGDDLVPWTHRFSMSGSGSALGTVRTLVSWAKRVELDPSDIAGQADLQQYLSKQAGFHTPPKP